MIDPPPSATIRSPTRADSRNGPLRLRLTTESNSFSVTEPSDSYSGDMPALLISTSTLPKRSYAASTNPSSSIPAPDVHLVRQRGAAGRGGDLLGGGHAGVVLAAGDDDVGAAVRGGEGHLPAQPAAAAGDQHHPVGEVEQFVGIAHVR